MLGLLKYQKYSFARVYSNYVNGEFVPSKSTKYYEIHNPVTQEHIARTPQSTPEEFNAIVAKAKEAFPAWSRTPIISTILNHF
jgi:malonate-semialdehyde dehydrogenase (acetylating)/methylmalonate-semialdehyde dehydrogenase